MTRCDDEEVQKWMDNADLYDVARCGDAEAELETLITLLTSGRTEEAETEASRLVKSWAQWMVNRGKYFGEEQ